MPRVTIRRMWTPSPVISFASSTRRSRPTSSSREMPMSSMIAFAPCHNRSRCRSRKAILPP
jgi:hypothetical protein